jgi:hypothetical protein
MRSNDNTLRTEVGRVIWKNVPKPSPYNDKKFGKIQDNLYGNTRQTDIQVAYFFRKYKGDFDKIRTALHWMSKSAIQLRLNDLSLRCMDKRTLRTDYYRLSTVDMSDERFEFIFNAINKHKKNMSQLTGIAYHVIVYKCKTLGLNKK